MNAAVIFDLDGVLTDTAELHFQSWLRLTREIGVEFDRTANEALRGLSRMESLRIVLGGRAAAFTPAQKDELAARKNEYYLEGVRAMTPDDALPGARWLLESLRHRGVPIAVASSSRNAAAVIERLAIGRLLDAVVDGNHALRSKPDPQVFLLAAEALRAPPARCVVVEDAESGVQAALSAGMRVVGVGPPRRVGRAHLIVDGVDDLTVDRLLGLLASPGSRSGDA